MLACARCKLWWMTPEWTTTTTTLPPETQFLLVDLSGKGVKCTGTAATITTEGGGDGFHSQGDGPYALLLPLIDGSFRATLRPS
eukprot:gene5707-17606_t